MTRFNITVIYRQVWFVLWICLIATVAWGKPTSELRTVKLFYENDLFGDTDKYYTNAFQITWLSKDLQTYKDDERLPKELFPLLEKLPFANQTGSLHNVGLLMGQQIYTPSDIQARHLLAGDRPYAGYLYAGIALHSKTDNILDTVEIALGIVGSAALGEAAQNTIHDLRDISTAKGWDNQLHNEPALRLAWQRKWRLHDARVIQSLEYDLISHTSLTLGNVKTAATAGGEIRFGYHIPRDFGSDTIRPGSGVSVPVRNKNHVQAAPLWGAHLFAGTQAEVVLRDIFLDGNTWQSSPSVDKKPLVADLSIGLAFNVERFKVTYRHLFRTKQFDNQKQDHVIGSLTLTYSF